MLPKVGRDDLADILRVSQSGPIKEAGEWRPLADQVFELADAGALGIPRAAEEALAVAVRELKSFEFGNPAFRADPCPRCNRSRREGHSRRCSLAAAIRRIKRVLGEEMNGEGPR